MGVPRGNKNLVKIASVQYVQLVLGFSILHIIALYILHLFFAYLFFLITTIHGE